MDEDLAASTASSTSEVAKRYAGALFDLAKEKKELEAVAGDLKAFRGLVDDSSDLALLLASPAFQIEDKVKGLVEVAKKASLNTTVVNFIGAMAQNGRTGDLLGAAIAFDALCAKHRGIRRAVAATAQAMTPEQEKRLQDVLAKSVGSDIELETKVDPSLVGGIQLQVGSTLIDASVAAKLDRMNTAMKGA